MSYKVKKVRVTSPNPDHEKAKDVVGRALPAIGGPKAQGKYFLIPSQYNESRKVIDLLFSETELEELAA